MLSSYYACRLNLVYSQLHVKLFCNQKSLVNFSTMIILWVTLRYVSASILLTFICMQMLNRDNYKNLGNQPSHVVKARINNCSVYHGSFHTLKGKGFLNDEVLANMWMFVVIMYNTIQIVNTYLKLLASIRGNCFVIISQVMTTIINR